MRTHHLSPSTIFSHLPVLFLHSFIQRCPMLLNSLDLSLPSLLQKDPIFRRALLVAAQLCLGSACRHPSLEATSVWGYRLVRGEGKGRVGGEVVMWWEGGGVWISIRIVVRDWTGFQVATVRHTTFYNSNYNSRFMRPHSLLSHKHDGGTYECA